jgi:hypothetical protein
MLGMSNDSVSRRFTRFIHVGHLTGKPEVNFPIADHPEVIAPTADRLAAKSELPL